MRRYEIRQHARGDLRDIAIYIGQEDPDRAETFVGELLAKIEWIADNPKLYRPRFEWDRNFRIAHHARYYILYYIEGDTVEILRVVHSSRDLAALLDELK